VNAVFGAWIARTGVRLHFSTPALMSTLETSPTVDITSAVARLRPYLAPTPMIEATALGRRLGHRGRVFLKCENLQPTGSFKIRGALNKLLSLGREERDRGVIAASTGNHGTAVAYALGITGGSGTVYVSTTARESKLRAMRDLGVAIETYGDDPADSERRAREVADAERKVYVSPYNDADVIAGQATCGVEMIEQVPDLDAVIVAVGGGGLVSGIGLALRASESKARIIGCWPEHSQSLYQSIVAGRVVSWPELPTLSDATAGGVEDGAITLDLCRSLIDESILVTEGEIAQGVRDMLERARLLVEGAAGVAVAAFRRLAPSLEGANVGIVLCGGNVSLRALRLMLE
jgi:threonine dehydratase